MGTNDLTISNGKGFKTKTMKTYEKVGYSEDVFICIWIIWQWLTFIFW